MAVREPLRETASFLDLGSRAAIPQVPGLAEATQMTDVEALELDRLPRHLILLGAGTSTSNYRRRFVDSARM